MKFSTDESDQDIIKVALSWLDRGFRPCVIYPRGFQRDTGPATGKEPFGARWGLKLITPNTIQKDIKQFTRTGLTPGLGLCLGPERAPGGLGLVDIEGDGPDAEDSRSVLFNGEVIATIGHTSTRGDHQFFSYDWSRLQPILIKLSKYQTKTQPGVYHLPQLPGLELRIGGKNDKGELKQLQSVIPPTPGTDGAARTANGVEVLAPVPESFYLFLEHAAQEVHVPPASNGSNGYHDDDDTDDPEEPKSDDIPANDVPDGDKKKRGRPKGSGPGTSIEGWLRKEFKTKLDEIANAAQGERHPLVMAKMKYLAGFLHYGEGFSREALELAGIEAANQAAPERAGDNPRCVKEAIRYGMTLPLDLPTNLHNKYTKFKKAIETAIPKPSTNGDGPGHREPGEDDPEAIASAHAGHNLTDLGNSRRLVDLHGFDIKHVGQWNSWYIWMGDRWNKDHASKINHLCEDVSVLLRREAALLGPDNGQDTLKWSYKSEGSERLHAMEKIAQSNPVVTSTPDQFDSNPWLLNCTNGTLDLQTGNLQPHIRTDLILKTTGTEYDPKALCPLWDSFLDKIFNGDTNLIEYVQTLTGYSCIGITELHILAFLSGDGNNGKSTYLETIAHTIGDYATTCDPDLLVENRFNNGQDHKIADLFGSRFVYTEEVKDGSRLAEGMVKRITGGSTIKACRKYEHPFDFCPTHTVWLAANQAPDIRGRDIGIWRRIKRIPFDVTIPESQINLKLKENLKLERSGILRWIVEGVAKWLKTGLVEPHAVTEAIEEYKEDTDIYGPYFRDYCDHGPALACTHAVLFEDFKIWTSINNVQGVSSNKFARILTSRGYKRNRTEDDRRIMGIQPNGKLKRGGNRYIDGSQGRQDYIPPDGD